MASSSKLQLFGHDRKPAGSLWNTERKLSANANINRHILPLNHWQI